MCNIYQVSDDVFRFELYNLNYFQDCDTEISGHYTFWYSKNKNKFVFCKHGDYVNLVSFFPINELPRFATGKDLVLLTELVNKVIRGSYFWNYDAPRFHAGRYLLDELENKADKDLNGWSTEYCKNKDDGYYTALPAKTNCIFSEDYPEENYTESKEYWDNLKTKNGEAVKLLSAA